MGDLHIIGDLPPIAIVGVFIIAGLGLLALGIEKTVFGAWKHGGTIMIVTVALMAAWVVFFYAASGFVGGLKTGITGDPVPRATLAFTGLAVPDLPAHAFVTEPWMFAAALGAALLGMVTAVVGMHNRMERPAVFLTGVAVLVAVAFTWFVILIPNTV